MNATTIYNPNLNRKMSKRQELVRGILLGTGLSIAAIAALRPGSDPKVLGCDPREAQVIGASVGASIGASISASGAPVRIQQPARAGAGVLIAAYSAAGDQTNHNRPEVAP